jgi:hypothetical protein
LLLNRYQNTAELGDGILRQFATASLPPYLFCLTSSLRSIFYSYNGIAKTPNKQLISEHLWGITVKNDKAHEAVSCKKKKEQYFRMLLLTNKQIRNNFNNLNPNSDLL